MTRIEQLLSLRDALKKAAEPDRELHEALGGIEGWERVLIGGHYRGWWFHPRYGERFGLPDYTGSIDAAVTLEIEGISIRWQFDPKRDVWLCEWRSVEGAKWKFSIMVERKTRALATCAMRVEYEIAKEQT